MLPGAQNEVYAASSPCCRIANAMKRDVWKNLNRNPGQAWTKCNKSVGKSCKRHAVRHSKTNLSLRNFEPQSRPPPSKPSLVLPPQDPHLLLLRNMSSFDQTTAAKIMDPLRDDEDTAELRNVSHFRRPGQGSSSAFATGLL